jgi:hypothetical protein
MNKLTGINLGNYRTKEYLFNDIGELVYIDWLRDLASSKLHKQFSVANLSLIWELQDGRHYTIGYFNSSEGIDKLPIFW